MKPIHSGLAVGPQITLAEIEDLARQGYRSIICARPDGEEAGQPPFGKIRAAAKAAGMEARHIPVQPGMIFDNDAHAFAKAMHELPGPVAAYCRSGMRAQSLWARAASLDPVLAEKFAAPARAEHRGGLFSGLGWLRQGFSNG